MARVALPTTSDGRDFVPRDLKFAASATPGPLLLLGSIDPACPGLVGMLAAGGALDQLLSGAGSPAGPPPD